MGQKPTEEELFQMISEVDENMSGTIDFGEFLKVIEKQKERASKFDDESDMVDAFVACGGNPDRTGHVQRDNLIKIIKNDFGLTIDIEDLIDTLVSALPSSPARRLRWRRQPLEPSCPAAAAYATVVLQDTDGSGEIDYNEFKTLLTKGG
jgi:Ca2+-binding EF-hand superfamily protein